MLDKLDAIKARFDEIGVALTNPEIVSNNQKFSALSKEYRSVEKIVLARKEYLEVLDDVTSYREALNGNDAIVDIQVYLDSLWHIHLPFLLFCQFVVFY